MTFLAKSRIHRLPGLVARIDGNALPPRAPLQAFHGRRTPTRNVNLPAFA
jgi:hypothetical protein